MLHSSMKVYLFLFVAYTSTVHAFTNHEVAPLSFSSPSRCVFGSSHNIPLSSTSHCSSNCFGIGQETSKSFVFTTTSLASVNDDDLSTDGPFTTAASKNAEEDLFFDGRTTIALVGGQSLLVFAAVIAAFFFHTPNYGFGPDISFSTEALLRGVVYTGPLFLLAYVLDYMEDDFPALQDVSKATQRSVIALLGGTFKPALALITSMALGAAAGFGEEMLFRGVCQYELAEQFGIPVALALSSIVFGALHAVTPLYAILATVASVYFGWLYIDAGNLAVPIVTHAVYDLGALCWAHYTVTKLMSPEKRLAIAKWQGPNDEQKIDVL